MSVFSKLSFLKLNKNCAQSSWGKAVKLGRVAASGSGSSGAPSADSSVLPSASLQRAFLLGTDTAKSPAPTQMFLQQLSVPLLHGYNVIPRGSWSTSAF